MALSLGYNDFSSTLREFTPNFLYLLYDITSYTDEEIKGEARIRILFTMFRDVQQAENIEQVLEIIDKGIIYLSELNDKQTGIEYFKTFMLYIVSAAKNITSEDTEKIINKIERDYSEGSEIIMTLADIWKEEGIRKGEARLAKRFVKNAIQEGMDIGKIEKLTEMSREEIEKIKQELEY